MLFRYAFDDFKLWAESGNPKCLVLRGARQVGKTTVVISNPNLFDKQINIAVVNLEEHPELSAVFASNDAASILEELAFITGSQFSAGDIVFLDEIQAATSALQAMRYLREHRPDLRFVAAGSLLDTEISEGRISVPVGRMEYQYMDPLSFEEFLMAHSDCSMELDLIRSWTPGMLFPQTAHKKLINLLRTFLVVGGMPEAVNDYIASGRTDGVSRIQASIINTYRDDFAKYNSKQELLLLRKVFDWVPARAGDKAIYSQITRDARANKVSRAIDLLSSAGIIFPVRHSSGNGVPLGAEASPDVFKLFFLDVGLMAHMTGISRITDKQILSNEFINKGRLAEQFIAQHLLFISPSYERPVLHYWLREKKSSNAEVDFLIQHQGKVVPIEVKAGKTGSMKSLLRFIQEKNASLAVRFDTNPPSIQAVTHQLGNGAGKSDRVQFDLLSLPLYMVGEVQRLLKTLLTESRKRHNE